MSGTGGASYLKRPRTAPGLEEFSYRKILVPSQHTRGVQVINWEITYKGEYLDQRQTLQEVFDYIQEKMDT